MNYTSTRYLGSTVTPGPLASGSRYVRETARQPHTTCWMAFAVYDAFPTVPSLAGTHTQAAVNGAGSLNASARAVGCAPTTAPILVQFELFDDESPVACANFRRLCAAGSSGDTTRTASNGSDGFWQTRTEKYFYRDLVSSYKGTSLHKIIPGFCIQGGDLTMRLLPTTTGAPTYRSGNHFAGQPARRAAFPDENKKRRHNEVGLLSMANTGPNSNGSQFFITTSAAHEQALNGRHVCFGRVTSGMDRLMREVAPCGDVQGKPTKYVVVVDCGAGEPPADDDFDLAKTLVDLTTDKAAPGAKKTELSLIVEAPASPREPMQQETPFEAIAKASTRPPPTPPSPQQQQQQQQQQPETPSPRASDNHPTNVFAVEVEAPAAEGHAEPLQTEAADSPFSPAAPDSVRGASAETSPERAEPAPPPAHRLKSSLKTGPSNKAKRVTIQM